MGQLSEAAARLLVAVGMLALAGCGRTDRLSVVPAAGKVLVQQRDGTQVPMSGAHIVLIPVAGGEKFPAYPTARAGPDGSFRLGMYAADDGAPEGEYVVTVEWHDRATPKYDVLARGEADRGPDKLKGACADRSTSPLRVTVAAGRELTIVVAAP